MTRIMLSLEPSKVNRWVLAVDPPPKPIEGQALMGRSFDFVTGALTAQGGWAVGALMAIGTIVWLIDRRLSKIGQKMDIVGTISMVAKTWQESHEILKEVRENGRSSKSNCQEILAKIDKQQRAIEVLFRQSKEVKEVSAATGEDLSGQLHQIESKLDLARMEIINNKRSS